MPSGARVIATARGPLSVASEAHGHSVPKVGEAAASEGETGSESPAPAGQQTPQNPYVSVYQKTINTPQGPLTLNFTPQLNATGTGTSYQATSIAGNGLTFVQPINTTSNGFAIQGNQTYAYAVSKGSLVAQPTAAQGSISYQGTQVATISGNNQITAIPGAKVTQSVSGNVQGAGNQNLGTITFTPTVSNGNLSLGFQSFAPTSFVVQLGKQNGVGVGYLVTTSYNPQTGTVSAGPTQSIVNLSNYQLNNIAQLTGPQETISTFSILGIAGNSGSQSIGPPIHIPTGVAVSNPPPVILSVLTGNAAYGSLQIGPTTSGPPPAVSFSAPSSISTTQLQSLSNLSLTRIAQPTMLSQISLLGSTSIPIIQLGGLRYQQAPSSTDQTASSNQVSILGSPKSISLSTPNNFVTNPYGSVLNFLNVSTTESKAPSSNLFGYSTSTFTTKITSPLPFPNSTYVNIVNGKPQYSEIINTQVPTTGLENVIPIQKYIQSYATNPKLAVGTSEQNSLAQIGINTAAGFGNLGLFLYSPQASISQRVTAAGTVGVIALAAPLQLGTVGIIGASAPGASAIAAAPAGAFGNIAFTQGSSYLLTGKPATANQIIPAAFTGAIAGPVFEVGGQVIGNLFNSAKGSILQFTQPDTIGVASNVDSAGAQLTTIGKEGAVNKLYVGEVAGNPIRLVGGVTENPSPVSELITTYAGKNVALVHTSPSSVIAKFGQSEGDQLLLISQGGASGGRLANDLRNFYTAPPNTEGVTTAYGGYIGYGSAESGGKVISSLTMKPSALLFKGETVNFIAPNAGESLLELSARTNIEAAGTATIAPENILGASTERQIIIPAAFKGSLGDYPGTIIQSGGRLGTLIVKDIDADFANIPILRQFTTKTTFLNINKASIVGPGEGASSLVSGSSIKSVNVESSGPVKVVSLSDSLSPLAITPVSLASSSKSFSSTGLLSSQFSPAAAPVSSASSSNGSPFQVIPSTTSRNSNRSSSTSAISSITSLPSPNSGLPSRSTPSSNINSPEPSPPSTTSSPGHSFSSMLSSTFSSNVSSPGSPSLGSPSPSSHSVSGFNLYNDTFPSRKRNDKESEAFRLFVVKKGKKSYIPGVGTAGQELQRGANIVRNTIYVKTFGIEDAGRAINNPQGNINYTPPLDVFRNFRIVNGKRVQLNNEYIEKGGTRAEGYTAPGARLSTQAEKQQIREARRSKKSRFALI